MAVEARSLLRSHRTRSFCCRQCEVAAGSAKADGRMGRCQRGCCRFQGAAVTAAEPGRSGSDRKRELSPGPEGFLAAPGIGPAGKGSGSSRYSHCRSFAVAAAAARPRPPVGQPGWGTQAVGTSRAWWETHALVPGHTAAGCDRPRQSQS